MKRNLLLLILPLLLAGCAHTVGYTLKKDDRWVGPKIDGVVYVQPIVDHTTVTNTDWRPHEEHVGGQVWRTNYRGGYSHTNLTDDVTAMIIKHLAYSGLFTKIVSGTDTNADYFFSGTLADFQTADQVNSEAEGIQAGSSAFGVIGAIVGIACTSGMKSEIKTSVKLDDLKLANKSGQIVWQDSVIISYDTNEDFEEASEVIVFKHPDQALKDAVSEVIRRMGNSSLTNQASSSAH
jgi:hypothetical protein